MPQIEDTLMAATRYESFLLKGPTIQNLNIIDLLINNNYLLVIICDGDVFQ